MKKFLTIIITSILMFTGCGTSNVNFLKILEVNNVADVLEHEISNSLNVYINLDNESDNLDALETISVLDKHIQTVLTVIKQIPKNHIYDSIIFYTNGFGNDSVLITQKITNIEYYKKYDVKEYPNHFTDFFNNSEHFTLTRNICNDDFYNQESMIANDICK